MNETNNHRAPESKSKIYIYVILGLLVVAVGVTALITLMRRDGDDPMDESSDLLDPVESFIEESIFGDDEYESSRFENSFHEESMFEESFFENSFLEESGPETIPGDDDPEIGGSQDSVPGTNSDAPVNQGDVEANENIEQNDGANGVLWQAFDPASTRLQWPVSGVVVKNYSVSSLIYDETLDLYAINDSISISAEDGEAVLAAADGVVAEIGRSDRLGNYVVLNNGNGYKTTYGQMDENLEVAVGDIVHTGDVLGHISDPSWYSVALGTHLTFQVTLQETAVNPLDYLDNELED